MVGLALVPLASCLSVCSSVCLLAQRPADWLIHRNSVALTMRVWLGRAQSIDQNAKGHTRLLSVRASNGTPPSCSHCSRARARRFVRRPRGASRARKWKSRSGRGKESRAEKSFESIQLILLLLRKCFRLPLSVQYHSIRSHCCRRLVFLCARREFGAQKGKLLLCK